MQGKKMKLGFAVEFKGKMTGEEKTKVSTATIIQPHCACTGFLFLA